MQWSDVTRAPSRRLLRQFAGLWLVVFGGMAAWRWFGGQADGWAEALAVMAVAVGVAGLLFPPVVRPIYTGWMVVAFPIGWTVSRVVLSVVFFLVITPLAWGFRLTGRDGLRLRRSPAAGWMPKTQPDDPRAYFRQF